jgi:hypothetical protein
LSHDEVHPLAERITSLLLNTPMPLDGKQIAATIRALMEDYQDTAGTIADITDEEILQRVHLTLQQLGAEDYEHD